ncbi:hypothetical protein BOSE127_100061 [Bosea sp. 127]|nr:hypothetical protein BOSE127_100061 [Bosea sp. 127]
MKAADAQVKRPWRKRGMTVWSTASEALPPLVVGGLGGGQYRSALD